jgi:putrescine aminotransferase
MKKPAAKPRRSKKAALPAAPLTARSQMSRKKLIEESRRWLAIINAHKLNDYRRRKIVADTLDNFRLYYNRGYLEYRKSVTEGGQFAAIEWSGKGSHFEDTR